MKEKMEKNPYKDFFGAIEIVFLMACVLLIFIFFIIGDKESAKKCFKWGM